MKKYLFSMVVMAIFAIGFAASDENESANSSDSTIQTEQNQESEKKKETELEKKKKDVEEQGYKAGYDAGFGFDEFEKENYDEADYKDFARQRYSIRYGAPSSQEEKELYDLYVKWYLKGINDGIKAQ